MGVSLSSGKFGVGGSEEQSSNWSLTGESRGSSQFWDQTLLSSQKYWRENKKNQTLSSGFKVFARYLTATLCLKRFGGNWLRLLPGYLGCFHGREGEIIYWVR